MFNLEVCGLNTIVTSKEEIMQVCRRIVAEKGMKALNMRLVADECHIASGTLYNYYANKDALVLVAVESIWKEISIWNTKKRWTIPFPAMWLSCMSVSKWMRRRIRAF